MGESKDLFFDDNSDNSMDNSNMSTEIIDNYMTEKAFHNDLESSLSITERSGKFIMLIYVELLRIIKPLEREFNSNGRTQVENSDIESDNS